MGDRFLAVRCPGCASSQVGVIGPDKFRCEHCSLVFVYDRRGAPPAPRPPTPRPPASAYAPPEAVTAKHGSAAGVIIVLVVLGIVAATVIPIVLFVVAATDDARQSVSIPRSTPDVSVRTSAAAGDAAQPDPLPCDDLAERYRSCLAENENHTEQEALAVVDPLREAAREALANGSAEGEEAVCSEQFEKRLERCERRGGLLGQLTSRPSSELDADEERPSLLARLRGDEPEPPEEPPVDLSRFQPLSGCECASPKGPRVELNIGVGGSKTVMGDPAYEFVDYTVTQWVLTRDGEPWLLPSTMQTAPPEALPGWRSTMGFGCANDTIVIASVRHVSAWSLTDRKLLWTTELDKPFGDELGLGRRGSYQLSCSTLAIRRNVVELPLDRRRKLRLGLDDGKQR